MDGDLNDAARPDGLRQRHEHRQSHWRRFNPPVSVYWVWTLLTFLILACVPLPDPCHVVSQSRVFPPAGVYMRPDLYGIWPMALLLHTLATLSIAVPGAVCHTVILRARGHDEPMVFGIQALFFTMTALAAIFGFLACFGAPPVVFFSVLSIYCGWPITLWLAGRISRRLRAKASAACGGRSQAPSPEAPPLTQEPNDHARR